MAGALAQMQPKEGDKARRCLATGEVKPAEEMIRFVVGPDGTVVPDLDGKLPGRGLWVTADATLIARATAKGRFKTAGGEAPADLVQATARLLRLKILSLIGLARRSGDLLAGFDVIERAVAGGEHIVLLIEAKDGAADGKRKLRAKLGPVPLCELFDKAALSAATGRDNAIHLGLKRSRLAEKIRLEMTRLAGLEGTTPLTHGEESPGKTSA